MPSFNTNIKVETAARPVLCTLWESSNQPSDLTNATSTNGEDRILSDGTIYVALSSVEQVPDTPVKVTVSTAAGSNTKRRRVNKKGRLETILDFVIDQNGVVS